MLLRVIEKIDNPLPSRLLKDPPPKAGGLRVGLVLSITENIRFRVWVLSLKGLFHASPSSDCFALWLDCRRQNIGDLKTIDAVFICPRIEGICVR